MRKLSWHDLNTLLYRYSLIGLAVQNSWYLGCHQTQKTLNLLSSACDVDKVSVSFIMPYISIMKMMDNQCYSMFLRTFMVENENARMNWKYSFATLRYLKDGKPDVVLLKHHELFFELQRLRPNCQAHSCNYRIPMQNDTIAGPRTKINPRISS